jgi:hypothetical protein
MGTGPEWERMKALRDSLGLQAWVDLPGRVTNELLFRVADNRRGISSDPMNSYNDHCTMNKVLNFVVRKTAIELDLKEGRASANDAAFTC